ncbi:outer membrane lipoprotein carrier protein LolA [Rhodovulum sp. BSW8]|uniref:Outer membrane lipoprotein-sorting protein n=1 Tax=Rhodovulum visakhapatnamense TaxID=364297 RepID=A0A4R8G277_9RHOB|nr:MULTISPECIES: outer membrane lipoprotein carrier protein LolA [Rhodovulum]RBO55214.1 outer membrane lipoprotein carrier protein LolA [Rhodovulum sp. BSW8]TDX30563.1 outer membrane lipoprotein-sorting protein [Rhodovulum visakhapatnamense]
MKPFRLSLALAALLAGTPALADPIPLSSLSAYLNSFQTAQADFTQINADGSISTGVLSIRRPGRARFEYAPPDKALVMAGGGQVAVFDEKSNQPPEQYPLKRTPLNLILERQVDLGRARMVVGHEEDGSSTRVVAQDPEHPEYGTITLVFTNEPIELRQWIVTDETGSQTTVVLGELKTGMPLGARLFNIIQETNDRMRH